MIVHFPKPNNDSTIKGPLITVAIDDTVAGQTDGKMDRHTNRTYRFPLYSTRLSPLQFPHAPQPCLPNSYNPEILEQGKCTNDQLLPLGNWSMLE